MPHHVTQWANRRQQTFFGEEDYQHYLELSLRFCHAEQVAIWAYCLMPNHVHLIVVPQSAESLHRAIGEAHRRHTRRINFREGWRGHLWQGRFASFVMDEDHLLTAARYGGNFGVRGENFGVSRLCRLAAPGMMKMELGFGSL
jgi:putative transposase